MNTNHTPLVGRWARDVNAVIAPCDLWGPTLISAGLESFTSVAELPRHFIRAILGRSTTTSLFHYSASYDEGDSVEALTN